MNLQDHPVVLGDAIGIIGAGNNANRVEVLNVDDVIVGVGLDKRAVHEQGIC